MPLAIFSHFPSKAGVWDYHKYHTTELEDFLPFFGPQQAQKLQLMPIQRTKQLAVLAPTHGILLLVQPPQLSGRTHSRITLIPLPVGNNQSRTSFMRYISPGFKMPSWQGRAPTVTGSAAAQQSRAVQSDALSNMGLVAVVTPGSDTWLLVDVTKPQDHQLQELKMPFNVASLQVLSPTDWLLHDTHGNAYTSRGAADGYAFSALNSKVVGASSAASSHGNAWTHSPQPNKALKKQQQQQIQQQQQQQQQQQHPAQKQRVRPDLINAPRSTQPVPGMSLYPPSQDGAVVEVIQHLSAHRTAGAAASEPHSHSTSLVCLPEGASLNADRTVALRAGAGHWTDRQGVSLFDLAIAPSAEAGQLCAFNAGLTTALPGPGQYVVPTVFRSNAGVDGAESFSTRLSVLDPVRGTVRHVPLQETSVKSTNLSLDMLALQHRQRYGNQAHIGMRGAPSSDHSTFVAMAALPTGELVTAQQDGTMRVWQLEQGMLDASVKVWRRLFGLVRDAPLRLELESDKNKEVSAPKHGKIDPTGEQHVGGNTWAGGSGGSDTAGLGGKGGPYRLDGGHNVHQVPQEQKDAVSQEVREQARAIAEEEYKKRLAEIDMAEPENELYEQYLGKVQKQVTQLRLILEQAEAKTHEREWLRNQNQGDLDDNKLVDALTGEKLVYRRRGVATQQAGTPQRLPKRLHFVLDLSGSMYRFNGSDQRLERSMETALLMMEALEGFEHKFSYCMVGHSGDGPVVPLVDYGQPPKDRKERLKVLQRMFAHAQYCMSGDFTLEALQRGVEDVVKVEADDYFVIAVSDANLARYGIEPATLGKALQKDPRVNAYCIFLASLQDEITRIMPAMPTGHAFFCEETGALPAMFRAIFTSSRMMQ